MNENYEYINKVLEKPLDSSQFASCCRKNNTIIAAGAGSGKTQVLASRFAWLVMSCNIKVEQILALTFTKKAASEIYQRIYQILRTFSNSAFTPAEEKQRAKIALKDFNKARIQTLDSYCSTIVKQAANKYGVRPDFKIGNLETLKNDALAFVIENKENFALLQFSKPGKLQNLANEFFVPIIENFCDVTCEENFFEKKLKKQKEEIVATWNFLIKRPFNLSESEKNRFQDILNKQIPDLAFIFESINSEISENDNNAELQNFSSIFYEFPEIEQLLIEDFENSRFQIEKIKAIFENSKEIASTRKKVFAIKYLKMGSEFTFEKEKYKTPYPIFESLISYFENFDAILEITKLLDIFMVQMNAKKRKNGVLSFKDVTALALKILKEQKDIRNQEKAAIKKIMIDEFQDNNATNRDMLFLLAEKDDAFTEFRNDEKAFYNELLKNLSAEKLFFVGDEKQSIYKFRGADVTVFNALEKDLTLSSILKNESTEEDLKLYMTNNYRIAKKPKSEEKYTELLASFNILFGAKENEKSLFENGTNLDYEAYYSKNATFCDQEVKTALTKENVPIHVCLFNKEQIKQENLAEGFFEDDFLDENESVAYYTAQKIKALYDEKKKNKEDVKYADFAILCKSRSNYAEIAKYLNYFNIPFSIDQKTKIFNDGPINDIYNFLRLCVFPQDKKAFASFLTSSFAGLNLETVQVLLTILPKNVELNAENVLEIEENENLQNTAGKLAGKISQNNLENKDFENFQSLSPELAGESTPATLPASLGEDLANAENIENTQNQIFKVKYFAFSENKEKTEEIKTLFEKLCENENLSTAGQDFENSSNAENFSNIAGENFLTCEPNCENFSNAENDKNFSISEWEKYCNAKEFFESYKKRALTESLTTIITELWFKTGYRYETLLNAKTNLASEQFDFLFELARTCEEDGHDIAWFVEKLEEQKQAESVAFFQENDDELCIKEISYPVEKEDAVEIMTIHKSKGLEFKHVFVFGSLGKMQGEKSSNFFYDEEFGLSLKLAGSENYFFNRQKDDATKKLLAEFRRVLYVAITRSEIDVYIVDKISAKTFEKDSTTGEIKHIFAKIINSYYGEKLGETAKNGEIYYENGNPFDLELLESLSENIRYEKNGENAKTFSELKENFSQKIENLKNTKPKIIETKIFKQLRISPSGFEKLHENIGNVEERAGDGKILANGENSLNIENGQNIEKSVAEIENFKSAGETEELENAQNNSQLVPFSPLYKKINQIIKSSPASQSASNLNEDFSYQENDERIKERAFNHGTFGTLAHAFLEYAIKTLTFFNFDIENLTLPFETKVQLKKDLKDEEFEILCSICKIMAKSFFEQTDEGAESLGKQALKSKMENKFCEPEFAFKLFKDDFFIKGFIDLIFENADGTFTIVDYKTDEKINPSLYFEQQAVYRLAAKEILGVNDIEKIKTKLFYLRYAKIVDITQNVNNVKIEKTMMQKVLACTEG